MCLIIAKPKGRTVPDSWMFNSWEHNSDSLGVSYFDDTGRQKIHKWVRPNKDKVRKAIRVIAGNKDRDVLIHFRFSTHGKTDEANCHPFPLGKDAVIAHNGVIPGYSCAKGLRSDTAMYVQDVLMPFVNEFGVESVLPALHDITHKDIGGSKLCALDKSGAWYFANENLGTWKDGCWLSNTYSIADPWKGTSNYGYNDGRSFDYNAWKHECYDRVQGKWFTLPTGWTREWRKEFNSMVVLTDDGTLLLSPEGNWTEVVNNHLIEQAKGICQAKWPNWEEDDLAFALYAGLCSECGNDLSRDNYCYECGATVTKEGLEYGPPPLNPTTKGRRASTALLALPTGQEAASA